VTPELIGEYFRMRRSIRHYRQEPVGREVLEQLFDIVRYAPTAINRQSVQWIIIYSPGEVRSLVAAAVDVMSQMVRDDSPAAAAMNFQELIAAWEAGEDGICRSAPHLIIAHAHKDDRIAPVDATIALSHYELAAPSFGLGACWAGYFGIIANLSPELRAAAGIPQDHVHLGSMMTGYPRYAPRRIPQRKQVSLVWK
jgi:nitroreductase